MTFKKTPDPFRSTWYWDLPLWMDSIQVWTGPPHARSTMEIMIENVPLP